MFQWVSWARGDVWASDRRSATPRLPRVANRSWQSRRRRSPIISFFPRARAKRQTRNDMLALLTGSDALADSLTLTLRLQILIPSANDAGRCRTMGVRHVHASAPIECTTSWSLERLRARRTATNESAVEKTSYLSCTHEKRWALLKITR